MSGVTMTSERLCDLPTRTRVRRTSLIYMGYAFVGMFIALPGACLSDIAILTSSQLTDVTSVLTWRYVGMLGGIVAGGLVYDLLHSHFLLAAGFLLLGVCLVVITSMTSLLSFCVVMTLAGFAAGLLCVGTINLCALMWKRRRPAILQGVLLFLTTGAFVIPHMVTPFLLPRATPGDDVTQAVTTPNTRLDVTTEIPVSLNSTDIRLNSNETNGDTNINSNSSNGISPNYLYFTSSQVTYGAEDVRMKYPFITIGVLSMVTSLFHLLIFCLERCRLLDKRLDLVTASAETASSKLRFKVATKLLCVLMIGFFGLLEENYASMLPNFAVDSMKWKTTITSYAVSLYWFGTAIGRIIGIVIVKYVNCSKLALTNAVGIQVVSILVIFYLKSHYTVLYAIITLAGIVLGSALPNGLAWAYKLNGVSGLMTSSLYVGVFVGKLGAPSISTALYKVWSPMAVPYLITIESALFILTVMLLMFCEKLHENKDDDVTEREGAVQMQELMMKSSDRPPNHHILTASS